MNATITANRDMRRYARVRLFRRRFAVIRCNCQTCHGVDYLRAEDYLAAHPTSAGWADRRSVKR